MRRFYPYGVLSSLILVMRVKNTGVLTWDRFYKE